MLKAGGIQSLAKGKAYDPAGTLRTAHYFAEKIDNNIV
jgi:hypothetical protein